MKNDRNPGCLAWQRDNLRNPEEGYTYSLIVGSPGHDADMIDRMDADFIERFIGTLLEILLFDSCVLGGQPHDEAIAELKEKLFFGL